jgi:hypothetical protein
MLLSGANLALTKIENYDRTAHCHYDQNSFMMFVNFVKVQTNFFLIIWHYISLSPPFQM